MAEKLIRCIIGKKPDVAIKTRWLLTINEGGDTVALVGAITSAKRFDSEEDAQKFITKHRLGEDYAAYPLPDSFGEESK